MMINGISSLNLSVEQQTNFETQIWQSVEQSGVQQEECKFKSNS